MIKYTWDLGDDGKIFLEKDPQPLASYPNSYQLRYENLTVVKDFVIDFNFNIDEPFVTRFACQSLDHLYVEYTHTAIDTIINDANTLVELGRKS